MYTYWVEWSPPDREWVGRVAEFPSLSWLGNDPVAARVGVMASVVRIHLAQLSPCSSVDRALAYEAKRRRFESF